MHLVPWRAVLHYCGLAWEQLAFHIGFNLILGRGADRDRSLTQHTVIALGHGTAGTVDLQEEARQFAAAFGRDAVASCTVHDVRRALEADAIVLISCHGIASSDSGDLQLELSSGRISAEDAFPPRIVSPLVILSACDSGFYLMAWSDYPLGAGPLLIQRGAECVIGARFSLRAPFAAMFFGKLALMLSSGMTIEAAFARALSDMDDAGADLWRDLGCLELLRGGRSAR